MCKPIKDQNYDCKANVENVIVANCYRYVYVWVTWCIYTYKQGQDPIKSVPVYRYCTRSYVECVNKNYDCDANTYKYNSVEKVTVTNNCYACFVTWRIYTYKYKQRVARTDQKCTGIILYPVHIFKYIIYVVKIGFDWFRHYSCTSHEESVLDCA